MEQYIVTGLISAAGAYGAVWAHLKFVSWRLDRAEKRQESHDKRLDHIEHHLGTRAL